MALVAEGGADCPFSMGRDIRCAEIDIKVLDVGAVGFNGLEEILNFRYQLLLVFGTGFTDQAGRHSGNGRLGQKAAAFAALVYLIREGLKRGDVNVAVAAV